MGRYDFLKRQNNTEEPKPALTQAPPPPPPSTSAPGNPDPRPDLPLDHVLWVTLLFVARRVDPYIRGLLWCTRYLGAGAEYDGKAIRIVPGQVSPEDYAQIRAEWMQPNRGRIVRVLEEAARTLQQAGVTGAISGGVVSEAKEVRTGAGQAETWRPGPVQSERPVWRPPVTQEVKAEPQVTQKALNL